ncbi:PIN domain-containing protein [Geitlerinema sp. CS-897]|nr:PIN domain-containing protein [Geitlerinema sp. CS-897]
MKFILSDTGLLGYVTNPKSNELNEKCKQWLARSLSKRYKVLVPEIADYEVRRELLRANKQKGLQRLNDLVDRLGYVPISREIMLKAAEFWANSRREGKPTAPDLALDADVILAAQAVSLQRFDNEVIIATTNVKHLIRFANAQFWQDVT